MTRHQLAGEVTAGHRHWRFSTSVAVMAALQLFGTASVWAQDNPASPDAKPHLDITGFAMLDTGYDFKQNDPAWFDVVRPTKLPVSKDQFGKDGNWYTGV